MVRSQRLALLITVLALLAFPLAHAATFGLAAVPIDNEIERGEAATYQITISNFGVQEAQFQAYTVDPGWSIKSTPLGPTVPAGAQGTFQIALRPTVHAGTGTQGVSVTFKDLVSGTLLRRDLVVSLHGEGGAPAPGYEATVALDILLPYDIDPRQQIPLRLNLRNRNALNITNLSIDVASPHFHTQLSLPLSPLSERTVDVTGLALDPRTAPGEEDVTVKVSHDGELVAQLAKNYRIASYSTVSQSVTERSVAFKATREITITNDGNVPNTAVVTVPTSLLKSLFISSDTSYEREVHDDARVLVWRVALAPGQTTKVLFTENYRVLVLLVLLLVLSSLGYILLRSPLAVVKEAVGLAREDGVSQLKVRLFIKNRSSRIVQGISVTDRVPSIADVVKADSPGSISPSKVAVSEKGGTLLRWDLEVLEPYEERVVTYIARSKLRIIGRLSLPVAKVRYTANGKERVIYSNNIEIIERFKDR